MDPFLSGDIDWLLIISFYLYVREKKMKKQHNFNEFQS